MKYKGYSIIKKAVYHVQEQGYTLSSFTTLAAAKKNAQDRADRKGVPIQVKKESYYSIQKDGFEESVASTLALAKRQINSW